MANLLKAGDGRSLAHGWLGGLTWWLTTIGASAVSSFYTAHSAAIQGLPAYRSIPIGAATFVAITVGFYLLSLARRVWMSSKAVTTDAKSESEKDDRGTNDALAQAGARIGNLEQQLRVLQARDDEYGWLRDVVAEQAQHLNSLVQIVNGLISDHDLTSESPFIELRFLLKNSSVFPVSIPNFDGKLLFGNYQFDNAPTFVGKPISNLAFWHHGGFDLRQELKKHEANMILNSERKSFAFHRIDFPLVVQGNDQHQSLHMSCEITNDVLIASYPKLKIEIKQALLTPHYDFDKQTIEAVTGMLVTLQIEFRNSRAS
ncbi:MAG TPA: hypothetical protein VE961_23005, partial [Pyrinomonadaceae bacterium]|nr:hypothetical protein [Pyrinomonadaceae bacterium]